MKISKADAVALLVKGCGFDTAVVTAWKDDRLKQKVNKLGDLYENKKIADPKLAKLMKQIIAALEDDETIEIAADKAGAAKGKPAPAAKGKAAKGKGKAAADEDDDEEEDEDSDEDEEEDADDEDDSDDDEDSEEEEESDDEDDDDGDDDSDDEEDEDDSDDDEEDSEEDDEDSDDGDDEDDADEDDDTDDDSDEDEDEESEDEEDDDVPVKKKGDKPAKNGKAVEKGPGIIQSIADILATATEQKPLTKDKIHEKLCKKFPERPKDSMWTTVNLQVPNKLRTDKGINVQKNAKGYYIAAGKAKAGKPAAKKGKEEPAPKKKAKKK